MASTTVLRGADIRVHINGKPYVPVTSVRFSISYGRHAIHCIDTLFPIELAPGAATIKGSIDVFRVLDGGAEGAGIAPPADKISMEKYFSLVITDRRTDNAILYVQDAIITDQNWQVEARGIMHGSISFEGLIWQNEANL